MAAVESRELVGAAHSLRTTQMRRGHEPQPEREQKAEQHLEDAQTIQSLRRQVRVALDAGRRITEAAKEHIRMRAPRASSIAPLAASTLVSRPGSKHGNWRSVAAGESRESGGESEWWKHEKQQWCAENNRSGSNRHGVRERLREGPPQGNATERRPRDKGADKATHDAEDGGIPRVVGKRGGRGTRGDLPEPREHDSEYGAAERATNGETDLEPASC